LVAEAIAVPGPVAEPIVLNGVTYTPGSGPYAGLYSAPGRGWVRIENGQAIPWKAPKEARDPIYSGTRSTGRAVGGVLALIVAGFLALLGWSWFQGFAELEAEGNTFSGMLALFACGAWVVAAAFGIWALMLFSRK